MQDIYEGNQYGVEVNSSNRFPGTIVITDKNEDCSHSFPVSESIVSDLKVCKDTPTGIDILVKNYFFGKKGKVLR